MNSGDVHALGVLSGGLDSSLALVHMHRLGYRITACHFANGFHAALHAVEPRATLVATAERLDVPIETVDNAREMLEVVKHPEHGYGSHVNPCIDCRILILRMAAERMRRLGARFLFTGEVVGQRPMSQRRPVMEQIERAAGVEGLVVRPLCGRLLPPTEPERSGLLQRDQLLALSGRSRKPQMALAAEYGMDRYESPAGGCLLTDPGFAVRLRDALRFGDPDVREVQLLKVGRHFRLSERSKAILGRNKDDCEQLRSLLGPDEVAIEPRDMPGPLATIRGEATPEAVRATAALVLRYTRADPHTEHAVAVARADGTGGEEITVRPAEEEEARRQLVAFEGGGGGFMQGRKEEEAAS